MARQRAESRSFGPADRRTLRRWGASVAVAGRSTELLEALAEQCSDRTVVVPADARDPAQCERMVTQAVDAFGGLDALVHTPGTTAVTELAHAEPDHWRSVFETNVFAACQVTAAAIPHLEASRGTAIFLSSVSAHVTPPWVGMGLYAASKVALEKTVEVWKLEHPDVRFTTIVIGSTAGGQFFADATILDPDALAVFQAEWLARGYLAEEQLQPEDQAKAVVDVLTSTAQMDVVWARPRRLFQLPRSDAGRETT